MNVLDAATTVVANGDVDPRPERVDRFGNVILDTPGYLGQYRIERDLPWSGDGRILRVCGEADSDKHLAFWDYDAGERRLVCRLCWPTATLTTSRFTAPEVEVEVTDDGDL